MAATDLLTLHLPGKHDQQMHGHGHGGRVAGRNLFEEFGGVAGWEGEIRDRRGDYPGPARSFSVVAHTQGFDGHPTTLSREDMDAAVAGGAHEVFRGLAAQHSEGGRSAESFAEEFRRGDTYWSDGAYGSGVYFAQKYVAQGYTGGDSGTLLRAALHPDARVISYREAEKLYAEHRKRVPELGTSLYLTDLGTYTGSLGYDAIHVEHSDTWVIMNRTALLVEDA